MSTLDDPLLRHPIVIVGAPRSGTTFLATTLAQHEQLAYLDEPRMIWRYGNDRESDMLGPVDARPDVIDHIRRAFAQRVRDAGRARLLEKTPSNALRLPFVDRVLPDALYVHIIRHGLDSVLSIEQFWHNHARGIKGVAKGRLRGRLSELSLRRLPHYAKEALRRLAPSWLSGVVGRNVWGPRLPGIDGLLKEMDLLDVCCLQWRSCVELSCHFGRRLPADRYFECRLEDMSPQMMERICAFCGLPSSEAVWSTFERTFRPHDAGRRKTTVDADQRDQILRWIEPTLRWLNYDVPVRDPARPIKEPVT